MQNIELKFKSSGIHLAAGIIWLVVAIINSFQLLFFSNFFPLPILFFITIVLSTMLAIHFLTLPKKTYVKVTSDYLFIYRDLIIPFYEISFSNISYAEITADKLFIIPVAGFYKKELEIRTNFLYRQDYEILLQELTKRGVIVKNLYKDPSL